MSLGSVLHYIFNRLNYPNNKMFCEYRVSLHFSTEYNKKLKNIYRRWDQF